MKYTRIINYSMVVLYTAALAVLAALVEAICFWAKLAPTDMMKEIATPIAETGFSVTVIAVSILAVITSISERRFFGIKVGEYLKFRRKPLTPAFYDVLIIILLIGTLQYAALAVSAFWAAAFMFLEIIALMALQIRWGLGIAFFYYGKEKEMRSFFISEMRENLKDVAAGQDTSRKYERARLSVISRIDNLFTYTKRAASLGESDEVEQNLSMLVSVLKMLIHPDVQRVWHNYETRLDNLIASILDDDGFGEMALWSLAHMLDIIMDTMNDPEAEKMVAQNCDFDRSRVAAFEMVSYTEMRLLREMFAAQVFYKLVVVKVYGIKDDIRKVARYAYYTQQFSENVAAASEDVRSLVMDSITALAPTCFDGDKPTDAALYTCLLIDAVKEHGISMFGLRRMLETKVHENGDKRKQHSVYMLMRTMQETLGMPQPLPAYTEESRLAVESLQKLLDYKPQQV